VNYLRNGFILSAALVLMAAGHAVSAENDVGGDSGEARQPASGGIGLSTEGKLLEAPRLEDGEVVRGLELDPARIERSFGTVAHSRDGKETKTPPGEAVKSSLGHGGAMHGGPALSGRDRQVFGDDDRVRITDTKDYPFRVIGLLQGRTADGQLGNCSATLIGPRTVLTAAHCLYSHEHGGWLEDLVFAPGLNGMQDAPYGVYEYETAYVVDGFISNYLGYYGSVVPWDLGLVVLQEPVGEYVGWMAFGTNDALGDFVANIVGYPGDKPTGTMWRANCDVPAEAVQYMYFQYSCDTFPGSSGSSVFLEDAEHGHVIYGVNVAESPVANAAVRINHPYYDWLESLVE
jgi:V8-like Glu-specific endopeptidase